MIVLSVFALARRYLPPKPEPTFGVEWSIADLSERFALTQWPVGISMMLVGASIAWGIHAILVNLNLFAATLDSPADIVLFPSTSIWWFLPAFAAITLAWEITLGAWARIGDQNEVMLYTYWTNAKVGFDSTRVLRIMALVIVLPVAILTALEVPVHTSLGRDEIRERAYGFSVIRIFHYSEARKLTVIQGFRNRYGELNKRAGVVLSFSDGRRWSSAEIGDFKANVDPNLINFLQAKTGLRVGYAVAESDID